MKNREFPPKRIFRYIFSLAIWIFVLCYVGEYGYLFIQRRIGLGDYPYYSAAQRVIVMTAIESFVLLLLSIIIIIRLYQNEPEKKRFWCVLSKGVLGNIVTCATLYYLMYAFWGTFEKDYGGFFDYLGGLGTLLFVRFFIICIILYCFWALTKKKQLRTPLCKISSTGEIEQWDLPD